MDWLCRLVDRFHPRSPGKQVAVVEKGPSAAAAGRNSERLGCAHRVALIVHFWSAPIDLAGHRPGRGRLGAAAAFRSEFSTALQVPVADQWSAADCFNAGLWHPPDGYRSGPVVGLLRRVLPAIGTAQAVAGRLLGGLLRRPGRAAL
ncbi:MAG: hypothetical protein PVG32_17585 [Anaerolineales bacterium]